MRGSSGCRIFRCVCSSTDVAFSFQRFIIFVCCRDNRLLSRFVCNRKTRLPLVKYKNHLVVWRDWYGAERLSGYEHRLKIGSCEVFIRITRGLQGC
jgi:hypothetical protein